MPVELSTVCVWTLDSREDETIKRPAWKDIERSIRALNNADKNDLYIYPTAENRSTWLAVGGGNGCYVVTGSTDEDQYPYLPNRSGSELEHVELCVGGQVGEYPSAQVVSLEAALSAVGKFFEVGSFDCGVAWEYA